MYPLAHRPLLACAVTTLVVAAALLARSVFDNWLEDDLPLATLFGAVALVAWLAGYRFALVAAAVGFLGADWLFIALRGSSGWAQARTLIALALYAVSCAIIIGLAAALRSALHEVRCNELRTRRQSRELHAMFDAMPTPMFISRERESRAITCNRAAVDLFGADDCVTIWRTADRPGLPGARWFDSSGRAVATGELPMSQAAATRRPTAAAEFSRAVAERAHGVDLWRRDAAPG